MYQMHFLDIGHRFFSGRGSFLALSAAGHVRGPPVHQPQVWAPAGLRGVLSRAN